MTQMTACRFLMVKRIFAPAQEHIARELYRGSYRSRDPEKTGPRRQLAVYSRGALQRRGGRGGGGEERTGENLEI